MLDALNLPILLKAIDFLFDEGRKILQERRERRRMANQYTPVEEHLVTETDLPILEPDVAGKIIRSLQNSKVDEHLWFDHEAEVQHLVRLLETYSRNYHLAKEQYAKWGSALVPPIVANNLKEAENGVIESLKKLETVLSKVYQKELQSNQ